MGKKSRKNQLGYENTILGELSGTGLDILEIILDNSINGEYVTKKNIHKKLRETGIEISSRGLGKILARQMTKGLIDYDINEKGQIIRGRYVIDEALWNTLIRVLAIKKELKTIAKDEAGEGYYIEAEYKKSKNFRIYGGYLAEFSQYLHKIGLEYVSQIGDRSPFFVTFQNIETEAQGGFIRVEFGTENSKIICDIDTLVSNNAKFLQQFKKNKKKLPKKFSKYLAWSTFVYIYNKLEKDFGAPTEIREGYTD